MSDVPIHSARRTKTYTAATLAVAAGVKTSFATSTSPVTLTTADWNGSVIGASGLLDLPRTITITRSNNAAQFSVAAITLTGRRGGNVVTETITPGNVNGNDVLRGTQVFDTFEGVALPIQGGTGGTFTIGVQDICAPCGSTFVAVRMHAAGTLNVQYGEKSGSPTDNLTVAAGVLEPIAAKRILTSGTLAVPTAQDLCVYIP